MLKAVTPYALILPLCGMRAFQRSRISAREVYNVEDRAKQTAAFAKILEDMGAPQAERLQVMQGVDLFFDQGWPSNRFTTGMAKCAGEGLLPFTYEGLISRSKYEASMKTMEALKREKRPALLSGLIRLLTWKLNA